MQSKHLQVFPTSRSIREYINLQKEFNSLLPPLITIDEFFKKVLLFRDKTIIDEEQRFLYLKEAVKDINLKALGISSSFSTFLKQSDYIYRFFLEISSENVDINDISVNDTYGFYNEHLQILKQIRTNYLAILEKNNAIDRINMQNYYDINADFIKRFKTVIINFEGYFTSFEFKIIKEISAFTNLQINFVYNELNKKSIDKIVNEGFDLELDNKYEIDFTNKTILKKENEINLNKNIEIKGFNNRINQIAFIKKAIYDLVNMGVNHSKIALILPDESFATTLSLFDKESYFNYAMGLNIYTTKLYKIIDGIYSYLNEDEIKHKENLKFLGLDKQKIDLLFKSNWKNRLTKDLLLEIVEFLLEYEKDDELIEKFKELVYKFNRLIFSSSEPILLKDAFKIFFNKVSKLTLDDVNSGKITVMGLLESRFISFDAVIICDFNESLIPKRSLKDKFLSTAIKQKVNLPTHIDRENLQKYYYKRLISNTKHLYISYVHNDNEQISRFATTLFKSKIDDKLYDNEYKHILYANKEIKHFNKEIKLDIDLSKLVWSASSLKEFLECKRKYYFNHILKIKEHDISLKPKGYELGNIVHNSLEEYYKQDKRDYKTLINIFNNFRSENLFLNLDLEIWKKRLKEFIQLEEKKFDNGVKILELEKPFLCEFEGIKIQGKIDRIDIFKNEYQVIDYKTSSSLKVDTKKTYEKTKDFQLEFYYLAVEHLFNTTNIKTFYYDLNELKLKEEIVLQEKLELLKTIFSEFKTKSVSFDKCDNNQTCQFCSYRIICNKD